MLDAQEILGLDYLIPKDKERRKSNQIQRYGFNNLLEYAFVVIEIQKSKEPSSYKHAMASKDFILWRKAMEEELNSLKKNHTWNF